MADVVYLHVGAPKTGTTYLQDRLALNRGSLERHGVHYPTGVRTDMFGAALDLIDVPWGGQRDRVHGQWDALAGRVRRASGTALVSHEILAGASPAQVRRAHADLGDAEIHLVYSARDLARQIPAEWQEGIKHKRGRSFRRFLAQVRRADRPTSTMWFWRVQGLPSVLERWSQGLPCDRVHLVTVPAPGAPRNELWLRYCRAFGLDPQWAPEDSRRENVSIGTAETTLVRKLNRRLRSADLDPDAYRRLVRQLIVHETLAQRANMTRVTLPPEAYPWAGEVAEEWISWVRGAGIDVVGDLDDLRPPPPPEGGWSNPDKPRPGRMTDAALDALVAVLVEAARHQEPEDALRSRVTRVARRLRGQ